MNLTIKPMLMTSGRAPLDAPDYIYEPMLDGQRIILTLMNSKARLFTRHNNEVTDRYPELLRVPLVKPMDAVFDGEVVFQHSESGAIDFGILMDRFRMKKHAQIRDGMKQYPVQYYIFDLLYADGHDLRQRPLLERKKLLDELIEDNPFIHKMPYAEGESSRMLASIRHYHLQGMACKHKSSPYVAGRSDSWIKITNVHDADVHNQTA